MRAPRFNAQAHVGHSSSPFTMTLYQRVLPSEQADAAAIFSEAVFGVTAP